MAPLTPGQQALLNKDVRVLYVIEATNGLLKFGVTHNLTARFSSIQGASPVPLEVIHVEVHITALCNRLEKAIHTHLAARKSHGEWFNCSREEVLEVIHEAKKGILPLARDRTAT